MRSTTRSAVIIAAIAILSGAASAQQQPARIAYVNPQALFENAPGRLDAEAQFRKETESYRGELARMNEQLNQMMSDYQKTEKTLTAAQKETE